MNLRALIVDDEAAGRLAVRSQCDEVGDLVVIGECESGREAIVRIREERPDVAFIDIMMRPISGLDVAASLSIEDTPAIVFVTAFDRYAVRAFDLNAVDYLLKPIDPARFSRTMQRVRQRIGHSLTSSLRAELALAVQNAAAQLRGGQGRDSRRLLVETGGRATFMAPETIECVEAKRNYVVLHGEAGSHTVRASLSDIEERLADPAFVRIHRSVLINTAMVRSMERGFHGEYVVEMASGRSFTSGRTYRQRLQGLLLRSRIARD